MNALQRRSLNDVKVIRRKRGENWNQCYHCSGLRRSLERSSCTATMFIHTVWLRETGQDSSRTEGGESWKCWVNWKRWVMERRKNRVLSNVLYKRNGWEEENTAVSKEEKKEENERVEELNRNDTEWDNKKVQAKVNWTTNVNRSVACFCSFGSGWHFRGIFYYWEEVGRATEGAGALLTAGQDSVKGRNTATGPCVLRAPLCMYVMCQITHTAWTWGEHLYLYVGPWV